MWKNRLLIILVCLTAVLGIDARRVLVLEIDEEIDATAWRHTQGAIKQIHDSDKPFDLFMLKLNTYGGAVDMADSIRSAVMKLDVPTCAFVDHNAASAGALIVLACDSAFMAPGSSIGAATVVNGQGEPMPPKYQNYWSSVMRSTAAAHGKIIAEGDSVARWRRDPDLFADMVIPERAFAYTTDEALAAGIIDGIAPDVRSVLDQLDMPKAEITYYRPTFTDKFMGFLASAAVRAILITLILGGIYWEMHTPGMGFAAAVAVVAAALFFLPMFVGGSLAPWVVILFVIGIVALALEVFVIPGFGIAGIIGIIAIVVSLGGAMIHSDSVTGISLDSFKVAAITLGVAIGLTALLAWFLTSKYVPKRLQRAGTLTQELKNKDGFIGVDMTPAMIVGKTGHTLTDLRPAGKVKIEGVTYDATSTGEFIPSHSDVIVVRYEAAQVYVEKV